MKGVPVSLRHLSEALTRAQTRALQGLARVGLRALGPLSLSMLTLAPTSATRADAEVKADYDDSDSEPLLPVRLDGHTSFTWDGYFGIGARVDIPLMEKGLSYSSRDELAISLGADVIFLSFESDNEPLEVWPTATVQWSLGVTERFSFYPELGLAAQIERHTWGGVFPNIGFGGRYTFHRSAGLMGRVGWPMAISLGGVF
jgi:hypothetical protein